MLPILFGFLISLCFSNKFWFLETFESDFRDRWTLSKNFGYEGEFQWDENNGRLILPESKKKYGMIKKIHPVVDNENKVLVLQFDVKFQRFVECGGAYIKLIFEDSSLESEEDLENFSDETLFAIMFGPDRCRYGEKKDKVQFIFSHQNDICGTWEEKHLDRSPRILNDERTHLYTLKIRPDNTFEIYMDRILSKSGSLFQGFEPPVSPPMYFKKNDPRLTKPKNIKNKCYYEPKDPYKFRPISAVGIDIYTAYTENISIGNILLTWDEEYADKLADCTWSRTNEIESYERPFHYDDDFNIVYDGPEELTFEKDFEYEEL